MSEPSPFKAGGYTPRGYKCREVILKSKAVIITVADCKRTQRKGRRLNSLNITKPRWKIYHGVHVFISRKIMLADALKEFRAAHPAGIVKRMEPVIHW